MTLYEMTKDAHAMKELHELLIANLREKAIEKVFAREETAAIAEAKELIDEVFESFKIEPKPIANINNEAR